MEPSKRFRPEFVPPNQGHPAANGAPANGAPAREAPAPGVPRHSVPPGFQVTVQPAPTPYAADPASPLVYGPGGAPVVFVPEALVGQVSGRRGGQVDYDDVRLLRRQLSEQLTRWLREHPEASDEERQRERDRLARTLVREMADTKRHTGTPLSRADEEALFDAVAADLVGLGRLQSLLLDDSIEEIHVLGHDRVRITRRDGTVDWGQPVADSDDELVETLQGWARRAGATERSLSTSRPTLDLQLPDGSRLAAVYLVSHRPIAVIRKHNTLDVRLDDVAGGRPDLDEMVDPLMRDFLRAAMAAGANIMVAGLAGAGKTTLLRALAGEILPGEPFVVLEESRELGLHNSPRHPAAISFEAREGHGERDATGRPAGEVTIADLIPLALRMGVLRIIVGEVRSREIVPMLQAMTTSRGSMCTIHARTPTAVPERIIELALSYGKDMTAELARRMAGNALDLLVYVTVEDETAIGGRKHRFVSHIEEVDGVGDGRIATTTVFGPGPDGRGIPKHLPARLRDQLLRVGYDPRQLSRWIEGGQGAWQRRRHTLLGAAS